MVQNRQFITTISLVCHLSLNYEAMAWGFRTSDPSDQWYTSSSQCNVYDEVFLTNWAVIKPRGTTGVDRFTVVSLVRSLGGDTAMPGRLHARLCHAFLVFVFLLVSTISQLLHQHDKDKRARTTGLNTAQTVYTDTHTYKQYIGWFNYLTLAVT